ncbi:MAG: EspA/EspE family type VII secretion system effector, partial [Mycobacterium sp.]
GTAAELDPHSYDPKNQGVPANIVVGRIKPVPGQGVVRANLFIPSESVKDPALKWPPFDDNAGDNRGFNPAAGPENSRVALEIDYENGVVVARQNPSVNLSTGRVKTGTPTVKVAQRRDGSVYIDYAAADPFSPGGESLAKNTICVQGQLAVQPGADAPRIGGVVTAFPALEVYHDNPVSNGVDVPSTTTVARMWPYNTGQWGPELGLPMATIAGGRHLPLPLGAVSGLPTLFPHITTELGSASNPPSVVVVK